MTQDAVKSCEWVEWAPGDDVRCKRKRDPEKGWFATPPPPPPPGP